MATDDFIQQFSRDVEAGLSASPKYLSSKYFYDATGDALFREIMKLPEYYLTRAEYEIFATQSSRIVSLFEGKTDIVELGPGDGTKTQLLLKEYLQQKKPFTYYPIDISPESLTVLENNLREKVDPTMDIQPIAAEYMQGLKKLSMSGSQKLILFMGSNIGNFSHQDARVFMQQLSAGMKPDDYLLAGFDLQKDPELILAAYNDSQGVTRHFNLNLLTRMNRELGAEFDITGFKHYAIYDPMNGEARSYLFSLQDQDVPIRQTGKTFHFDKNEPVFMEVSRKYTMAHFKEYASISGLEIKEILYDCKHYFAEVLFTKKTT